MAGKLQIRRDTAANWSTNNPVLSDGEIGWDKTNGLFKIGDGTTAWNSLPYSPYKRGSDIVVLTSGSSWTIPAGVKRWKVTAIGGGGQGGGTGTTTGQVGGGGGAGGVTVGFYDYVAGQPTMSLSIGAGGSGAAAGAAGNAGTATTTTYSGVTYTAGGGSGGGLNTSGGAGGVASGGALNINGDSGENGGVMAATSNYQGAGGDTPMGFGFGGEMPVAAAGAVGNSGAGYGGGGSGGRNGTGNTSRAGGAGAAGAVIIEY